ncbi:MAG TPA: hypothetical protein VIV59_11830 [Anaeromyxobacteraceae bacterium]
MDKLEEIAPRRLSLRVREGLSGHHPLFDLDAIRRAFAGSDGPVIRLYFRLLDRASERKPPLH